MWHLLLYTEEPNTLTLGILYSNENQASLRRVGVLSGSSFLFYTFFLKQPAFNSLNFYLHSPRIHGFVQMSIPLNWIYKPNAFPNWIQIIASWNRQLFKSVFFKIIDFFSKIIVYVARALKFWCSIIMHQRSLVLCLDSCNHEFYTLKCVLALCSTK